MGLIPITASKPFENMKTRLLALCCRITMTAIFIGCYSFASAQHRDYPIAAVPFTKVKLTDNFWLPRIKTNHHATIPASFERCESTGRVKNFEMAAARSGSFCTVYPFDDTDIYKTIEGASFSLSLNPDKALEIYIDSLIVKIAQAQEPDGYLYTARTIDPEKPHKWAGLKRWEKERDLSHELYNSGLYEAAAAHYEATGKRSLLNIALKNADLVCSVFGPGKLHVAPGHQVVEMGLVKLYRITGKKEYLETAKFFVEERGRYKGYDLASKDVFKNGAYWQDHKPVVEQDEAVGHAVRAGYLYAAVADVAALTGDQQLLAAIDRIWKNVVEKKIYVQGGIGASGEGERFAGNYELPNATAYNETCAAIANVYWNQRMFQLHGDAQYIDILERTLYNGLLSGVGMDGKSFFYTNAMEIRNGYKHSDMEAERSGWFTCSCCPTNITRLIPSVPGYMYAIKDDAVYVNLFASSASSLSINKKDVTIIQENNYPWNGDLTFKIDTKSPAAFRLMIRIPGWAQNKAMPSDLYSFTDTGATRVPITLNGKAVDYTVEKGYAVLSRSWKKGDVIRVALPMAVQKIVSHPNVENNIGRIALQRGPLVYCAEWPDNFGMTSNIILPLNSSFTVEHHKDLLQGVTVLKSEAYAVTVDTARYQVSTKTQPFTAIPYYAWAHRGKGEMMIWLPYQVSGVDIRTK
jgi:uncharacterized protein